MDEVKADIKSIEAKLDGIKNVERV
jgi:hypothetical protein